MIFEIENASPITLGKEREDRWVWHLRSSDSILCRSGIEYDSEDNARSDIAAFKRAMGSVRYAKVVTL